MKKYLLDTNAFFEMLSYLAGRNVRKDIYDFADIRRGKCYVSKITELEILSVIGKYRRGEPSQWQKCTRQISIDGTKCNRQFYHIGKRAWNKKLCTDIHKLVKEMIEGTSPILTVHVLELSEDVIERAEVFMMHAAKHKFGSQDALIAATAIKHSIENDPMYVVTSDRGLRAAMLEEGMEFVVPGIAVNMEKVD
jgi:predicted nucleic acid-binding protein